jgi:hypothetical protein
VNVIEDGLIVGHDAEARFARHDGKGLVGGDELFPFTASEHVEAVHEKISESSQEGTSWHVGCIVSFVATL